MFTVLKPVIDNLVGELKKLTIAFQNEHPNATVGKVILTGGGAYLLGLIPYLSESLSGVEIVMGDPFSKMTVDQRYTTLGPVFAIAFGLSTEI
jgi:Tfp pilus assembly PilM family ATPase